MAFCLFLSLLLVAVKAKTLPGSCSFQGSTCDYIADSASLSWTIDPNKHYITVEADMQGKDEKAVLLGPDVEQQDWSCLRLVYQLSGSASLHIHTRSEGESFDHTLWSANTPSDSWIFASIDLKNSTEPYKLVIEGRPGSAKGSSVSIFEINISDQYCIDCDFEDTNLCGYTNQWNGNVNWYVGRGAPINPANSDGPGHYMYVDSIHSKNLKEVAKLMSPMTTVPMMGCLSFQYQQDHAEGHLFSVYSRDQVGQYKELWRASEPESNQVEVEAKTKVWIPVQAALRAPYPIQVVFEASFNSPRGGRVLLDDISFSSELCSKETEPTIDPVVANCNFELGFCQYTQKGTNSELWKRVSVRPNIYRAGDHTTGRGFFLLANSCFALQSGYISRLYGPPLPDNQKYCLKFFYSLRGFSKTDQTLSVYLYDKAETKQEKIWTQSDSNRDVWIQVELTIQSQHTSQVVFISTCKNFWNCVSAAIDDISLRLGDCEQQLGPSPSFSSFCDFENGLCGYTQDGKSDIAHWVLNRGPTPTSYTGPKGDHTTGFGHYLYIEASQILPGQRARLVSIPIRGFKGAQCLLFFYHMYGSGTGQLSVLLHSELEDKDRVLWERNGEQSMSWLRASLTYQYDHSHQIVFEATRGSSVKSDIAIDDIIFQKGLCEDAV
ncbi:MAM domain-containing protein 2 [Trichomycterus rosablanca]|uniref:MAM domain-containing protein 2 n=1 Tax=Trichomycterus rosablanca TaxID=2290929 RepID=UPI002F3559D2